MVAVSLVSFHPLLDRHCPGHSEAARWVDGLLGGTVGLLELRGAAATRGAATTGRGNTFTVCTVDILAQGTHWALVGAKGVSATAAHDRASERRLCPHDDTEPGQERIAASARTHRSRDHVGAWAEGANTVAIFGSRQT